MVRVLIVTTPIRPKPTYYPPIASLSLIKYLRKKGFDDVHFYNIDGNRPSYDAVLTYIKELRPDVIGISAVVSTAYGYTKKLSNDLKKLFPQSLVVVGGNMAASANVLLHKTGTDICVLGEGEITLAKIVERAIKTKDPVDYEDIPGLMYLSSQGQLINTGYESPLPGEEIWDYDFEDLENSSRLDNFIFPAFDDNGIGIAWYDHDPRSHEPHRQIKKVGMIDCAKGCVARCTFCHRWDKGIRHIPVDRIMRHLEYQIENYDVGFVMANAETFGADKRWLAEFCDRINEYDILWRAPGIRANSLDEYWIKRMKETGCVEIASGNETGSEKMLQVMEKKVDIQDNYNLVERTAKAGISAPVQLVVGMPGETDQTVNETIKFCQFALSVTPEQNPNDLSINYAQALPGTPLYEFGRNRNLIGQDLDGEEAYLLSISDRDAHDEISTLNFTDSSRLTSRSWRPKITINVNHHYVSKYGIDHYNRVLSRGLADDLLKSEDTGYYANPKRLLEMTADGSAKNLVNQQKIKVPGLFSLLNKGKFGMALICHPKFFYRIRTLLPLMVLFKEAREEGIAGASKLAWEHVRLGFENFLSHQEKSGIYKSLRKTMSDDVGPLPRDEIEMAPLRKGR